MNPTCPRCGHSDGKHWPDHERPITSCVTCQDEKIQTSEADGRFTGTCCHPADGIRIDHAYDWLYRRVMGNGTVHFDSDAMDPEERWVRYFARLLRKYADEVAGE